MHIVNYNKKTNVKKGYVLINIMFILMICSLVSISIYRIIYNNLLRSSINYSYTDLYNNEYVENIISQANFHLKDNNVNLDDVKLNKQTINIDSDICLKYDYMKNIFVIIDSINSSKDIKLRNKFVDDTWVVVPYEQKYIL